MRYAPDVRAALVTVLVVLSAPAAGEAPDYELRTSGAVTLGAGEGGTASLAIVPARGHRIHESAPVTVSLRVSPEGGLRLSRRRLSRQHAADPRAVAPRFVLPLRAETAGEYTLTARVRFWICARRTCRPVDDEARIPVRVEERTPPHPTE